MANFDYLTTPILHNKTHVLVLPTNSTGKNLDPLLVKCERLFPDNHKTYHRQCLENKLTTGRSLMLKQSTTTSGLGIASNSNTPDYIANLIISDHAYHAPRLRWIETGVQELSEQLFNLMRYHGVRHVSIYVSPLLKEDKPKNHLSDMEQQNNPTQESVWNNKIIELLQNKLIKIPKLNIHFHVPEHLTF